MFKKLVYKIFIVYCEIHKIPILFLFIGFIVCLISKFIF